MDKAEKHSVTTEAREYSQNYGESIQKVNSDRDSERKHSREESLEGPDEAGTDVQDRQDQCPLYIQRITNHRHGRCFTVFHSLFKNVCEFP